MKKYLILTLFTVCIFLSIFSIKSYSEYPDAVKFLKVYTENSAYVEHDNRPKQLRLSGIYVPDIKEIDRYFYTGILDKKYHDQVRKEWRKAKRNFINNINSGDILYFEKEYSTSKGNVISGYIKMPDQTIYNINTVREGLAYPLLQPGENLYKNEFKNALKYAIDNKKGLWRVWKEFGKKIPFPGANLSSAKYKYDDSKIKKTDSFTIMTYNVENLFDTKHDEGKNDYTWLPKSLKSKLKVYDMCKKLTIGINDCFKMDWNNEILDLKLTRLAEVIKSYNNGYGPDFLVLQEVENFAIAEELRKRLGNEYKQTVLIEGDDYRGIDSCIISKYPLASEPFLHEIKHSSNFKGRGVLESSYWLPGKIKLTILAFHLPSQGSTKKKRIEALESLHNIVKDRSNEYIIAAGDSNLKRADYTDLPIIKDKYAHIWTGWGVYLKEIYNGTYYHNGNWEKFDVILFSKLFQENESNLKFDYSSIKPHVGPSFQYIESDKQKIPNRFKYPEYSGVSDHFPLAAKIIIKAKE